MAGLHITLPFHRLTFCLVRRQATDFQVSGAPRPSIETTIEATEGRQPAVQVDNELGEGPPSPRGRTRGTRRPRERMLFTQTRFASPDARFDCDGWCEHSDVPHANVVSTHSASFIVGRRDSYSSAALPFCLLGLATGMGGTERLPYYSVMQLPQSVYTVQCHRTKI